MKTAISNTMSNHNSLASAARMNRSSLLNNFTSTLRVSMQAKMKRFFAPLVMCVLAIVAGVGVAHAGQVTVKYQTFPAAAVLDSNVISKGCETATADSFAGYEFLFWDNQGVLSWNPTVSICPGSGNTLATAWYLATGCSGPCNCPPSGCYVTTFAFSIDHQEVLAKGTAIASVAPNSPIAWTSPMTTVLTNASENITADSSIAFSPYAAEPFRFWQQLGTTTQTPIGEVYQAAEGSSAWVVAFYGPDPCQAQRNALASCLENDGEGGKLNCAPFGKALELCESENREPLVY
jgi:hypothetical protein